MKSVKKFGILIVFFALTLTCVYGYAIVVEPGNNLVEKRQSVDGKLSNAYAKHISAPEVIPVLKYK